MNKLVAVLQSRKFWFTVIGLATSLGLMKFSDGQASELAGQIVAGVTAILVMATALEDGLRGLGGEVIVQLPEVDEDEDGKQ